MINKVIKTISILLTVYVSTNFLSAYFKTSLCKKYIEIKSILLAKILIADGYIRMLKTDIEDRNKMTIFGFVSYIYMFIFIGPFIYGNIFSNSQEIQKLFFHIYILNLPLSYLIFTLNNLFVGDEFEGILNKIGSFIFLIIMVPSLSLISIYYIGCIYNDIKLLLI